MTREILEQLRERTAFKPSPPEFEMAAAYDAMCSDDEAFVIVQDEHFAKNHCWHHVPVPHIPPLRAKVAVDLGSDLTQLVSSSGWGGNPINGLLAIRDLAAAREARLVIVLDDTDTWAEGDETLALRARDFFVAVRAIAEVPEVTMFVAIQDHWAIETDGYVEPNTDAARAQYRALAERAARVLHVPLPSDVGQAHELIAAIINRRVEITLDQTRAGGWTAALFDQDAVALLADRIIERSVRHALADIRNAFDHTLSRCLSGSRATTSLPPWVDLHPARCGVLASPDSGVTSQPPSRQRHEVHSSHVPFALAA